MAGKSALLWTLVTLFSLHIGTTRSQTGGFAEDPYEVLEGETVNVSLALTSPATGTVTVTVTCANPPLLSPNSFMVTFNVGESGPIVTTLMALIDMDSEDDVRLCITDLADDNTDDLSEFGRIDILDADNVPMVEFNSSEYTVAEDTDGILVCVVLTNVMGEAVTVTLSAEDGDKAVSGTDYNLVNTTIMFDASSEEGAVQCAFVDIVDDDVLEGDHSFTVEIVSVSSPARIRPGTANFTTITITDNDMLTVSLQPVAAVTEGSSGQVCVEYSAPSGGVECDVTVQLNVTDGKADSSDYMFSSLTVTISPPGFSSPECTSFSAAQDMAVEGEHGFTVSIDGGMPSDLVTVGTPSSQAVTILDDDESRATVAFDAPDYTVIEGNTAVVNLDLILEPMYSLGCDLMVTLVTVDGDAILGSDFMSPSPSNVTFTSTPPSGRRRRTGPSHNFNIATINDSNVEGVHFFTVSLQPSLPGVMVANDTTVTIVDNDSATVRMAVTMATFDESDGVVMVCAELANGNIDECQISVVFGLTDDTACFGDDYNATADPVVMEGGVACLNITIFQDSLFEGNETFTVFIEDLIVSCSGNVTVEAGGNETMVTILDDEVAMVACSVNSSTVNEGESTTLTFEIISPSSDLVAAPITFNVFAVDSPDYSLSPVTIMSDEFTVTVMSPVVVTLTALDDLFVEGAEYLIVEIDVASLPAGVSVSGNSSHNITILDEDLEPFLQSLRITTNDSCPLEGDMVEVTVSSVGLMLVIENDITVPLTVDLSGGASGDDFTPSDSIEVVFTSSTGLSVSFIITTLTDTIFEGTESFTLSPPCAPSSATIDIKDANVANISMVYESLTVLEDDTVVTVCAVLNSPVDGTVVDIVVELGSMDTLKAVGGEDFMDFSVSTPTVTFSAGAGVGNVSCADIMINEDMSFEGNHTFPVDLSAVTSPTTGSVMFVSPTETLVTIVDDDTVFVALYAVPEVVTEGGSVMVCLNVTSIPNDGIECNVTVVGETQDGTATSPDDFGGGQVTYTLTSLGFSQCFEVNTSTDDAIECEHYFTVAVVSAGPGPVVVIPEALNITIEDASEPMVVFTPDDIISINESDAFVTVCATITFTGVLECDYEIDLEISDDDLTAAGQDYVDDDYRFVFLEGSPSGTVACTNITILDDEAFEGDHSFTVLLPGFPNAGQAVIVEITDNDDAIIGLESRSIAEGETEEVCAVLTVPADGSEIEIVVTFAVDNGFKAVEGEDFSVVSPLEVEFPHTMMNGTQQCINVSATDDDTLEGTHSFMVNLTDVDLDNVALDPSSAVIDILDGDNATVGFEQLTYMISEGDGSVDVCVELSSVPRGGAECDITVTLAPSDGAKAVLGEDFSVTGPLEAVFMADMVFSGATACATITIIDDDALEGSHNFTVAIVGSDPPLMTSSPSTVVTIEDNDDATLGFEQPSYLVSEGDGLVSVCVEITDVPADGAECDIVITLAASNGSKAVVEKDFSVMDPLEAVFVADMVSSGATACANITILDDDALEGSHDFTVAIMGSDPPLTVSMSSGETEVTIEDNDEAVVAFYQAVYSVGEGAMSVEVEVELVSVPADGLECPIIVILTTVDGRKAMNNTDFILEDVTVYFGIVSMSGDRQMATVIINEDNAFEGDHSFNVTILSASPAPNVVVGSPSSALVIIGDNDMATVMFADDIAKFWVDEGAGELEVCLTLISIPGDGLECDIIVPLYTADYKAVLGEDFYEPYPVVFTRGSAANTTNCTYIPIIDDQALEGTHDFSVHIAPPPLVSVARGSHHYTTVYIHDNDNATVAFMEPEVEIKEYVEYQYVQFCLVIDDLPAEGLECDLYVKVIVEGYSAKFLDYYYYDYYGFDKHMDYDFTTDYPYFSIHFHGGNDTENGTISCYNTSFIINNDLIVEYDEHFLVSIYDSFPLVQFAPPDAVTVIIVDDDVAKVSLLNSEAVLYEGDTVELCTTFDAYLQRPITFSVGTDLFPFGLEAGDSPREVNGPGPSIALPMSFPFGGNSYDSIYVHSSGVLVFDGAGLVTPEPQDLPVPGLAAIAAYWEDVDLDLGGALSYRLSNDSALLVRASYIIKESFPVEGKGFWPSWLFIATWVDVQSSSGWEGENSFQIIVATDGEYTFVIVIYCDLTWGYGLAGFDAGDNETYLQLDTRGPDIALLGNSGIRGLNVYKVSDEFLEPDGERNDIYIPVNQFVFGADASPNNTVKSSYYYHDYLYYYSYYYYYYIYHDYYYYGGGYPYDYDEYYYYHYNSSYYECFSVTAINDGIKEGKERFPLRLTTKDPAVYFYKDLALVTVIEDPSDVVYVDFETASYEVLESEGAVYVCVVLTGTLEARVTAVISVRGGTATQGEDFYFGSKEVVFDGCSDYYQCVYVPIINDVWVEYNETLYLDLDSEDDCVVAGAYVGSADVLIVDDDTVALGLDSYRITVEEADTFVHICASVLWGGSKRNVTALLTVSDGTALAGYDYSVTDDTVELLFTPLETDHCIYISILEDDLVEGTEDLTVSLSSDDPSVEIKPRYSEATIYIEEDDDHVVAEFSRSSYYVFEGDGVVHVCVYLDGNISRTVHVTVCAINGTAEADGDFGLQTYDLYFSTNTVQCFYISILTGDGVEHDEFFTLLLTTQDPAVWVKSKLATVTIIDTDGVKIGFKNSTYHVGEGDGVVEVCVCLEGVLERSVVVSFTTADSYPEATAGEDYKDTLLQLTSVDFTFGNVLYQEQPQEEVQCVNITIFDDSKVEFNEQFLGVLSTDDDDVVTLYPNTTTIVIWDDDKANLTLDDSQYEVEEGDGYVRVCVSLTAGDLERPVEVTLKTGDGTATDGEDYDGLCTDLTFMDGSVVGEEMCVMINITDDDALEDDESFSVSLSSNESVCLNISEAEVTINNDDMLDISLDRTAYEVAEEAGLVTLCIVITSGEVGKTVSIDIVTTEGSATGSDSVTMGTDPDYFDIDFSLDLPLGSGPGSEHCFNVTIFDDLAVEYDETFTASISVSDPDVNITNDSAVVTIVDTDKANFTLEQAQYEVEEGDGYVRVCVSLTAGDLERPVEVTLKTGDGTATDGEDYDGLCTDLTFMPGSDTELCVMINITDDDALEDDESFSVSLSSNESVCLNISEAEVTINNDDMLDISLDRTAYEVAEEAGFVTLCIVITSGEVGKTVSVDIATTEGSATGSDSVAMGTDPDYFDIDFSLDLPLGSGPGSEHCFNVTIFDDLAVEYDETFTASISVSDPDVIIANDSAVVTIVDTDKANFTLEQAQYEVDESYGYVRVCVSLTAGDLERPVEVTLKTGDGTATDGEDYDGLCTDLTFMPGSDTELCVMINITEDDALEDDESFSVSLSSNESVCLNISEAEVTINNDDMLDISLDRTAYEVAEEAGLVTLCIVITSGEVGKTVSIDIVTTEGSATGSDSVAMGTDPDYFDIDFSLDLPLGSGPGSEHCFNVTIFDDLAVEYDETFTASISVSDPDVNIANDSAVVTIVDTDKANFTLEQAQYEVEEGDGYVRVCVSLTAGDLERPVEVTLKTGDGTATDGEDYDGLYTDLTFMPGSDTELCVMINITDDNALEDDESFSVSLSSNESVCLNISEAEVTINNDDMLDISLDRTAYEVAEEAGLVTLCIVITSGEVGKTVSVDIATTEGSATGSDSVAMGTDPDYFDIDFSLDLPLGSGPGSEHCFNVTIFDDLAVEYDETFTASISVSDPDVNIANDSAVVTIVDTDKANLTLDDSQYEVDESYGYVRVCVSLTAGDLERPVEVTLKTGDGTATDGEDYDGLYTDLTFMPGSDTELCVMINITDDNALEDDESFSVSLSSNESVCLNISEAEVTINNDDMLDISLDRTAYEVAEEAGLVTLCIVITSGEVGKTVSVDIVTTEGSATGSDSVAMGTDPDYFDIDFSLDLPLGSGPGSEHCFNVTIFDDLAVEYDETFTASISVSDPDVIIANDSAVVTIVDTDMLDISLDRTAYEVAEEAGLVTLCIVITSGEVGKTVSVDIVTTEGSATGSDSVAMGTDPDYFDIDFSLDLPLGSGPGSEHCFNVTIFDDLAVEYDETFTASISVSDPDVIIANDSAVVTIVDTDTVDVSFTETVHSVMEGDGQVSCTVQLSGLLERNVLVDVMSSDGTATAGDDYSPVDSTLEFTPLISQFIVVINITDDDIFEECFESFTLELTTGDTAVVLGEPDATVTIEDDESVELIIEAVPSVLSEGQFLLPCGLGALFQVSLVGDIDTNVPYSVAPVACDSAMAGDDFSPAPQAGMFTPASSGTVLGGCIDIVDDDMCEPVEQFCLEGFANKTRITFTVLNNVTVVDDDGLDICLFDDSPVVAGADISGVFSVTGATASTTVTCTVTPNNNNPPAMSQDCSLGAFDFSLEERRKVHVLTIEAEDVSCGQSVVVERVFRQDSPRCHTHAINKGVVVSAGNVTFEWQVTGPTVGSPSATNCQLDSDPVVSCTSPYVIPTAGLASGTHTLQIIPTDDVNCNRPITRTEVFELP